MEILKERLDMSRIRTGSRGGHLYLIQCVDTDFYKIGFCITTGNENQDERNIENRIRTLQTGCPFALKYWYVVWYDSHIGQHERAVHNKFWKNRVRGEWFRFVPDDIAKVVEEISNTKRAVKEHYKR